MTLPRLQLRLKPVFEAIDAEQPQATCQSLLNQAWADVASQTEASNVRDKAIGEVSRFVVPGVGIAEFFNLQFVKDHERLIYCDVDLLEILVRRRGNMVMTDEGTPERVLEGADLLITLTAAGHATKVQAVPGSKVQALCVRLPPSSLTSHFGIATRRLPAALARFFSTSREPVASERYVLPDRLSRMIDSVISSEVSGKLREHYLRAKAMECLTEVLDLLLQPQHKALRAGFVTKRPHPFEKARDILQESFADPPSLDDLAKRCGVSRRKLTDGFRRRYGTSIMSYALKIRMEEARRLLRSGELTVKQVGYRLGYLQHANFTQAYSGYFGRAPSKDRE